MLSALWTRTVSLVKGASVAAASLLRGAASHPDAAVVAVFQVSVLALGVLALAGSVCAQLSRDMVSQAVETAAGVALPDRVEIEVERGDDSWGALTVIYGALTGLAVTLVTTAEINRLKRWRATLILIDAIVLLYVVFLNDWSRNQILGMWLSMRQERH